MNNSKLLYIAAILVIFISCSRQQMPTPENGNNGGSSSQHGGDFDYHSMAKLGGDYFDPVEPDSANRMIMSYLNGINYGVNTNAPRAFIYDADTLRNYLSDTSKGRIKQVKFIFAHTMDYINSGMEGKRPDTNKNAITMIIVGIDQNNNYVLNRNNKVYDNCMPCPSSCPNSGTAAYNIIQ